MEQSKPPEPRKGPPPWMLSLADLISLLLTFFVMLFAMSSVKVDQWNEMIDSLNQTLKPVPDVIDDSPPAQWNISTTRRNRAKSLEYVESILGNKLKDDPLLSRIEMTRTPDRLVLSLPSDVLFFPGQAALSRRARPMLDTLGVVLRNLTNKVSVHGHSDPRPLSGRGAYRSNWELSLARAVAVANELRTKGYQRPINVYGFADSRYNRTPANLAEEDRMARARRVDIVIEYHRSGGFVAP